MLPVLLLLVYAGCCRQSKAACCFGEAFGCLFVDSCDVEADCDFESNCHVEANCDVEANDQSSCDVEGQGYWNCDVEANCHVESNAKVHALVDIGEEGHCRSTNTSIVVPVVLVLEY